MAAPSRHDIAALGDDMVQSRRNRRFWGNCGYMVNDMLEILKQAYLQASSVL